MMHVAQVNYHLRTFFRFMRPIGHWSWYGIKLSLSMSTQSTLNVSFGTVLMALIGI